MAFRVFEIPTPTEKEPFATQRTTLGERSYRLDFAWNQRRELWELSIFASDDSRIAMCLPLLHGWDILAAVSNEKKPPGSMMVLCENLESSTLQSLATDSLFYLEEVAE